MPAQTIGGGDEPVIAEEVVGHDADVPQGEIGRNVLTFPAEWNAKTQCLISLMRDLTMDRRLMMVLMMMHNNQSPLSMRQEVMERMTAQGLTAGKPTPVPEMTLVRVLPMKLMQ
jgi:hypothetical protein